MKKNLSLKMLSLLIALTLYFFVHGQSVRTELTLTLPVEFKNLPDNKFILLPTERRAQVTLRGPSFQVSTAASSTLAFKVRLPDQLESKHEVVLGSSNLHLPDSVEAYSIRPDKFQLVLDDIVSKEVSVEVPTLGSLSKAFKLVGLTPEPNKVEIFGPATEINEVSSIETSPLDLRNISESSDLNLSLRLPGNYVKSEVEQVKVYIDVTSLSVEKKIKSQSVNVKSKYGPFVVSPVSVSFAVRGPKNVVQRFSRDKSSAYVEVQEDLKVEKEFPVKVKLPKGVNLIYIEPETVSVKPRDG